jgi:ribonuclease HI/pterin-4a-carbinolamine dehydratase
MWQEKNNSLYQKFEFADFNQAVDFINKVASAANELNHHPKIVNSYNVVELELSTHSAGNKVTDKDRQLAEIIDALRHEPEAAQDISTNSTAGLVRAKLFTDGGSRGNPGPSALGYVILDMRDGIIKEESEYLGETTNNQAEYKGLIAGMQDALSMGVRELEVYMDSQLVVNQVKSEWKVKNGDIQPVNAEAKALAAKFKRISFNYVPRAMNKIADGLVNECLDSQ